MDEVIIGTLARQTRASPGGLCQDARLDEVIIYSNGSYREHSHLWLGQYGAAVKPVLAALEELDTGYVMALKPGTGGQFKGSIMHKGYFDAVIDPYEFLLDYSHDGTWPQGKMTVKTINSEGERRTYSAIKEGI